MTESKPIVAIRCTAYNHELYIRQTLDGFVMQKTKFPFIAIVHEDASTDGTAAIIREYAKIYPDIIKPIYEIENQYSKPDGSFTRIINEALNATGAKYIAMCEGDDYWTDPFKLQKQVDFLEANPEYGLCYTKASTYLQIEQKIVGEIGSLAETTKDLLKQNAIPTLSTLYRYTLLEKYLNDIKPATKNWKMGDYPMWLYFSMRSKIKFFPEVTCVYRILEESASHSKDLDKIIAFEESATEIRLHFYQLSNLNDNRILQNIYRHHFEEIANHYEFCHDNKYSEYCLSLLRKCDLKFFSRLNCRFRIISKNYNLTYNLLVSHIKKIKNRFNV